jgi:endonuclease/exonuclease/phosphatase family metal-dependent hydrolase
MKRLAKYVAGAGIVIVVVFAALLAWTVYSFRPVYRDDRYPAQQAAEQSPAKSQTTLKVLTFNIQMLPVLFGKWINPINTMQHVRTAWIADYLKQHDYDVVCLEEAFDPRCVKEIVDGVAPEYPYVVLPRYGSHCWQQSNGVLFVSRVPIKYVANVIFPKALRIERYAAKGCTLVEGVKDGLSFQIAGTHFQTGESRFRLADSKMVADDLLKPHRRDNTPQLFIGDFNLRKGSPDYVQLLKDSEMHDFPIDDPRPYSSDSNNSWKKGKQKLAHIDHILLDARGTQTAITVQHIERHKQEYGGKMIDLSDHYGVSAEVLLKN